MDSVDALLAAIDDASHHGFARVKLKYRPDWDESMLRRVRDAFPNETFHIDCNAGYRIVDTDMFKRLDEYDLAMIEQPLNHDDLLDHAELAANIKTPICLDESISSVQLAKQALRLNACGYVNIKPGRVGGITIAKVIHDICAGERNSVLGWRDVGKRHRRCHLYSRLQRSRISSIQRTSSKCSVLRHRFR